MGRPPIPVGRHWRSHAVTSLCSCRLGASPGVGPSRPGSRSRGVFACVFCVKASNETYCPPTVSALQTPSQVAEALGVTTKTLTSWRAGRTGPGFVRIAGRVYYTRASYETYWHGQTGEVA